MTADLDAIVAHAMTIPGWTRLEEVRWLAEQARSRHRIIEVGSWQGRTSYALAAASPGYVMSLDTLVGEPDHPDLCGDVLREAWTRNLGHLHADSRAMLFVTTLPAWVARWFPKGAPPVDFQFIDGGHSYETVLADCLAAKSIAAPGSIIAGHDAWMEGVGQAVREVFPGADIACDTIWAWQAPQ